jgi:hypothetical protein
MRRFGDGHGIRVDQLVVDACATQVEAAGCGAAVAQIIRAAVLIENLALNKLKVLA